MIWAVILAAGGSRRMGVPKLLLPYETVSHRHCEAAERPKQSDAVAASAAWRSHGIRWDHHGFFQKPRDAPPGRIASLPRVARNDNLQLRRSFSGGRTIIETVIERVSASRVDRTLVVLGSHWRTMKELIRKYPVVTAVNVRFKQGMLSSIQRGISALPRDCRAAVIVLGDQPDTGSEVINRLLEAYRRKGKKIVVPIYGQKRGHPVLIDLKFRDEIAGLNPEIGLRELLHKHPDEILEVRVPDSSILLDIDTPADYQKALKTKEKR